MERLNQLNKEYTTSELNDYMLRTYPKIAKEIQSIEDMSYAEFRRFGENCERTNDFLGTKLDIEKEIIRKFIVEKLSKKDKFKFLKYLWLFIGDNDLEKDVLNILHNISPNERETMLLNQLERNGNTYNVNDNIDKILSKSPKKDKKKKKNEYVKERIIDIEENFDFDLDSYYGY